MRGTQEEFAVAVAAVDGAGEPVAHDEAVVGAGLAQFRFDVPVGRGRL